MGSNYDRGSSPCQCPRAHASSLWGGRTAGQGKLLWSLWVCSSGSSGGSFRGWWPPLRLSATMHSSQSPTGKRLVFQDTTRWGAAPSRALAPCCPTGRVLDMAKHKLAGSLMQGGREQIYSPSLWCMAEVERGCLFHRMPHTWNGQQQQLRWTDLGCSPPGSERVEGGNNPLPCPLCVRSHADLHLVVLPLLQQ